MILLLFNIAMENGPFMDDFPTKTSIYKGFSMAMLNNQRVFHDIQILNMVVFRAIKKKSPIYGASGIVGCFFNGFYMLIETTNKTNG